MSNMMITQTSFMASNELVLLQSLLIEMFRGISLVRMTCTFVLHFSLSFLLKNSLFLLIHVVTKQNRNNILT